MNRTTPVLMAALLWAAPAARAADPAAEPDPGAAVHRDEVVVVSATRTESSLVDAPATVSVVTGERLQAAPARDWAEMVRGVPGVNVVQLSAFDFNLTAREATSTLAGSQIALVDGRSIYLDAFGIILWQTISVQPSEVQQIEVVRGPASVVWGGNAMTGVVNVITRAPRQSAGTRVSLSGGTFSRDAGSDAGEGAGYSWGLNATHAAAPSEKLAYRVSAGWFDTDAFPRPAGSIPVVPDPRIPGAYVGGAPYPAFANEGSQQPKLDLRLDQELGGAGRLTYSAGLGAASGIIHSGIGPFRVEDDSTFGYGRVAWARGGLRVAGSLDLIDAKAPSLLATDPFTGSAVRLDFQTRAWNLELSDSRPLGQRHLLGYGGNLRYNDSEISLAPTAENRTELGAYVQDEYFVGRFRLSAGLRVDKYGNLDDPVLSPRVAVLFKPTPRQSLRLSFNRAFRSPSVVQNYQSQAIVVPADLSGLQPFLPPPLQPVVAQPFPLVTYAVGSADLREESLTSWEAAWTGQLGERTSVSLAYYLSDHDDSINQVTLPPGQDPYTPQSPPPYWVESGLPPALLGLLAQRGIFLPRTAFGYANLGPLRNQGLELGLEHRFSPVLSGHASYSWQKRPEILDDPQPYPAEELNLPPSHRFEAGLHLSHARWLGSLSLSYAGRAFWSDVLTPAYHGWSEDYALLNASFGARFHGGRTEVLLHGTNLLDQDVQQHVFGDILKRSVRIELRLAL